ncbi:glycoside hydrolase family 130 protein [Novosphingobium cyanobacteriorum]|uniref:Glycoside hydrolase family 130 protein n=1 Tax=Novosphingobium cyanobacteriorum TaxID=3024215 RepID=A0ABT6CDW5_9SPHN|nr:glycoside hydrolase family 130 protein [Novosphingobium cyanobacteriorum]MDF8332110.1 glycoside hydrolase family 130 protein [Novosphingobium cyanobacteriorum]
MHADPSRVVLRPFHLGWQGPSAHGSRAARLVADVLALPETEAEEEYGRVLFDFQERHWQTEQLFETRYREVETMLGLDGSSLTDTRRKLIGAYFCHEYTYAAAALMNPSIVPHPDQSGMSGGAVRFVMSLRAVGEGHISSIVFREGIAHPDGTFQLWPQSAFATAMVPDDSTLIDADAGVTVHRHAESSLSNSVIFPITEQQRGGLEDLRLVRFDHGDDAGCDGRYEWVGTYTAYSGSSIRSELMRTCDFRRFVLEPVEGVAGRNKGMALFPEKVNGRFCMVGRQDGKNLFLMYSDRLNHWDDDGVLLMEPKYPWEFIQIGNCGSPILTDAGWLLLTHGVGAMRKYALGCALLDRDDPSKVIARCSKPLLTALDADRYGYVPNVVYTCGAMKVGGNLFVPYGISDSAVGFATTSIEDILALMD